MKVIALQGKEKTGKTTTLVLTLALMQINSSVSILETKGNSPKISDTWIVFEHKGKTIGITTRGDTGALIKKDFDAMSQKVGNIDVFVCAVHSSGETVSTAEKLALDDTLLLIGKTTVSSNDKQLKSDIEAKVNNTQAADLVDIILL